MLTSSSCASPWCSAVNARWCLLLGFLGLDTRPGLGASALTSSGLTSFPPPTSRKSPTESCPNAVGSGSSSVTRNSNGISSLDTANSSSSSPARRGQISAEGGGKSRPSGGCLRRNGTVSRRSTEVSGSVSPVDGLAPPPRPMEWNWLADVVRRATIQEVECVAGCLGVCPNCSRCAWCSMLGSCAWCSLLGAFVVYARGGGEMGMVSRWLLNAAGPGGSG
mmetsp:Transcript_34286/g.84097  ORF Transcript_34286/g.84097 Transcript_34286/m.84097 type:complete len:221 (+) Transcript_34286:294-956(+)